MNTPESTGILVLAVDLFPDANTVNAAIEELANSKSVVRCRVNAQSMIDADWDKLLVQIQRASLVITV